MVRCRLWRMITHTLAWKVDLHLHYPTDKTEDTPLIIASVNFYISDVIKYHRTQIPEQYMNKTMYFFTNLPSRHRSSIIFSNKLCG